MIVVIAHVKGGTGKTTTATQLAIYRQISHPERKVWLIDADTQQSALDTISLRSSLGLQPSIACASYTTQQQLVSQLNSQASIWDDIIIDCGGRDTETMRVSLLAADKLIVPVLPRAYDLWSLKKMREAVEAVRQCGAHFTAWTFINRFDKSADCKEAKKILEDDPVFTLLPTVFSDRVAYSQASGVGKSVCEIGRIQGRNALAVSEVKAMTEEIFDDHKSKK